MDIHRPELGDARRRKRLIIAGVAVLVLAAATFGVARMPQAAPEVDDSGLFIDTVKRGDMVRQVRGTGTLVPEQVRWIPAATEARVERILVRPGVTVMADTVILELSNPEVEQAARDAELQLGSAVAELRKREIELESSVLAQRAVSAGIDAQLSEARLQADVDEELARNGLTSALTSKLSRSRAEQLATRADIERKRLDIARKASDADMTMQRARVDQIHALHQLRQQHRTALLVRAGIDGVLQQVPLEVGQRVAMGTNLARVAQPMPLKAELRVAETQARDVAPGQLVEVDTRNGVVRGRVTRVDPAVQNGTIGVDVAFDGPLPKGARPDLTVDGVIELERLTNVLYAGRPVQGSDGATVGLFRLTPGGDEAVQTSVAIGRTSVSSVEIRSGLREGDRVILSDMSAWSEYSRIRLK
ncbi:MAG TPA: HlyD family efflux transporter periplasmic adaptor subunit [Thermoanaerobaculia bacterium]|nr:HlyD family efflux transporter periplasmic adaptor subunit [Thermoanaerobaculia bacterium]